MKPNVKIMVEGALAAAMTVALSYVKLWEMPQGGSITLEAIPLLVFSLRRGVRPGIGAGAIAGLLQLLLGGYIVHPVQAVLDYPLAFAVLGLAGTFRKPPSGGNGSRQSCEVCLPRGIRSGLLRELCPRGNERLGLFPGL